MDRVKHIYIYIERERECESELKNQYIDIGK